MIDLFLVKNEIYCSVIKCKLTNMALAVYCLIL